MKRFLVVVAGAALGALVFYAGMVVLDDLSSEDNEPVIVVVNDSKSVLDNALFAVEGMPESHIDYLQPHDYLTQSKPKGRKVAFRLAFDVLGRHYEFPGEATIPFGIRNMAIRVDNNMQIAVHAR
jgi:hypothetical protein